jgi:hypothetical protein
LKNDIKQMDALIEQLLEGERLQHGHKTLPKRTSFTYLNPFTAQSTQLTETRRAQALVFTFANASPKLITVSC